MEITLRDISRVESVDRADIVNDYISIGWVLLYVGQYENKDNGISVIEYVVGWPSYKGKPAELSEL